jgi:putative ABC transport system permease protein
MVNVLSALDRKMLRDLRRIWMQALAIAVVLGCGVALLIMSVGSYRSLEETRSAYYARHLFGDVFATVKRAPVHLRSSILAIDGVAAVELRASDYALLDIEGMIEPASGLALSLPDFSAPSVNQPYLISGRLPRPGRRNEVAVTEAFAEEHGFIAGNQFAAILNGKRHRFEIVGTFLSPEFVYAMAPGDLMPDPRRFAVLLFSEHTLKGLLDLEGAFNDLSLRLEPEANEQGVIEQLNTLLGAYGGTGAIARKDQVSHAFLDGELEQLRSMAAIFPPIFLAVTAFLINTILSRLIALEREQIGLMKALGYSTFAVTGHYLKLVAVIGLVGILFGYGLGTWLGQGLFRIYADFFHFPFLIFNLHLDIYLIAAGGSLAAALAGGLKAVWSTVQLSPAVAMTPPAPAQYRRSWIQRMMPSLGLSGLTMMGWRHLFRHPVRSAITAVGTGFAVGLLATSMFFTDLNVFLISWLYEQSERQDATIVFTNEQAPAVMQEVERLPGVLLAEPNRSVPAILRSGHLERRVGLTGRMPSDQLSRLVDRAGRVQPVQPTGLTINDRIAEVLEVGIGDTLEVEMLQGKRRTAQVPIVDIFPGYFGLGAHMNVAALNRLAGEGPRVGGANVLLDPRHNAALYRAVKETPQVASVVLLDLSRQKFQETLQRNVTITTIIYVSLSIAIAFGVVYNAARIQLSERARELASLRVLGFTDWEVFSVLAAELGTIVLIAQPIGWLIGAGITWLVVQSFESDLYRVPMIVEADSLAIASLVSLVAVVASAWLIWLRVRRLDLISVLKTRD